MRNGIFFLLFSVAASAALAQNEGAGGDDSQGEERAVTFELGTGIEYDSNVAVLELDTAAGAGDAAAQFEFGVGYDKPATGRLGLQAGYDFSQTLHEDFDAFDVRIHRGSGSLSYDLGRVDTGVTFQYAYAELDGSEFLTLEQTSPYVSKLIGERLFLRFAYAYSDKNFAGNPPRDATANSLSSDTYIFLNGLRTYLVFGYRYDDENAVDAQFDYAGHKLNAQLSRRLTLDERELTLKTELRYETRDYEHPTLSIGAPRQDDRYQFEASLEIPVSDRSVTRIGYKHADNRSNLASVDFDENVLSVSFNAIF
jgi:hypothetical protein